MDKYESMKSYIIGGRSSDVEGILREQYCSTLNGLNSGKDFDFLWGKAMELQKIDAYQRGRYPVCSITRCLCAEHCDDCWPAQVDQKDRKRNRLRDYIAASWNLTYIRDRFKCQLGYCKDTDKQIVDGLNDINAYRNMTIEHLLPVRPKDLRLKWDWEGENWAVDVLIQNSPENLVCACRYCNAVKGNRLFELEGSEDNYLTLPREVRLERAQKLMESPNTDIDDLNAVRKILKATHAHPSRER